MDRLELLKIWLWGDESQSGLMQTSEHLKNHEFCQPVSASSDASFRRYFRIQATGLEDQADQAEPVSFIIMDAPPEHEDCRPFIEVSKTLAAIGLKVPQVLEQDLRKGFLLLTDLGSTTYLSRLQTLRNESSSGAEEQINQMYLQALNELAQLQAGSAKQQLANALPKYDQTLLNREMDLFSDWLCRDYLAKPMPSSNDWNAIKETLIRSNLAGPTTYVHRDYHSRNLMYLPNSKPGILDFQDAVRGPLSYDAVSLLRDCYIAWPQEQVSEWQRAYFLQLCKLGLVTEHEWQEFVSAMDLMGIQRHLKASGIFARLWLRDGKQGYLADIPQTLDYIVQVAKKYPELNSLTNWVDNQIAPAYASSQA